MQRPGHGHTDLWRLTLDVWPEQVTIGWERAENRAVATNWICLFSVAWGQRAHGAPRFYIRRLRDHGEYR